MNHDEIINTAISELKKSKKVYKMLKDFSFMNGLERGDDQFRKIRHLLLNSDPFEKHSDYALKFSKIGLEISNNHKDWFAYKKSLKPKTDYVKWIGVGIAGLSLIWNIYQGITNSKLRDDNRILGDEIEALEKENTGLEQLLKKAQE